MQLGMNSTAKKKGLTRIDLFVVVSVIALLLVVLLPMLAKRYAKSAKTNCTVNLKQIALAFKMFAGDNDGKFPWMLKSATTNSANQPQVWEYFQMASNELGSARILSCPMDAHVKTAIDFSDNPEGLIHPTKQNNSISYFLGVYSGGSLTNSILAGDRTLTIPNRTQLYSSRGTTPIEVSTNSVWSSSPAESNHDGAGNYAMADGSVQQASTGRLQEALRLARDSYGTNANCFLFPQ